jgi:Fe2+ transport system protein FeoA
MKIQKSDIGKIYEISEIMRGVPCQECDSCIRLRLMEMGLTEDEKIEVVGLHLGLWRINILSKNHNKVSTFALRDEEMNRVCIL